MHPHQHVLPYVISAGWLVFDTQTVAHLPSLKQSLIGMPMFLRYRLRDKALALLNLHPQIIMWLADKHAPSHKKQISAYLNYRYTPNLHLASNHAKTRPALHALLWHLHEK